MSQAAEIVAHQQTIKALTDELKAAHDDFKAELERLRESEKARALKYAERCAELSEAFEIIRESVKTENYSGPSDEEILEDIAQRIEERGRAR
jgi:hypothetical protein